MILIFIIIPMILQEWWSIKCLSIDLLFSRPVSSLQIYRRSFILVYWLKLFSTETSKNLRAIKTYAPRHSLTWDWFQQNAITSLVKYINVYEYFYLLDPTCIFLFTISVQTPFYNGPVPTDDHSKNEDSILQISISVYSSDSSSGLGSLSHMWSNSSWEIAVKLVIT